MPNYGKIAHLPQQIREELNRRMDDGEMGVRLVEWLNGLPEVKEVLKAHFNNRPISEQNLSEWKEYGWSDWRGQQDALASTQQLIANASELSAQAGGKLTESLATVVAARYATALKNSRGKITDELRDELKTLKSITREVVRLRRSDQALRQLQIREQWLEMEQSRQENRKNAANPMSSGSAAKTDAPLSHEETAKLIERIWLGDGAEIATQCEPGNIEHPTSNAEHPAKFPHET